MKTFIKIILLNIFMFLNVQANSGVSFLTDFVCNSYMPYIKFYKDNSTFNYKQFLTVEYKYVNRSLFAIDKNIDEFYDKEKLNQLKEYFIQNREILDQIMKSHFKTTLTKISAIHNMITDDSFGTLSDLFEIYIMDKEEMITYGKKMSINEKKIKEILLSIIQDVDPNHKMGCE